MLTTDYGGCGRCLVGAGFDLAVSLLKRGIGVIGLDADPLAPGLFIPGITSQVTAGADDPAYPAELLGLFQQLRPDSLFSTVEHELPA
jgi:carbamoyl-phosphate synthase large subunit